MSVLGLLLPPAPPDAGGGVGYDRALVAALRAQGHDVSVRVVDGETELRQAWAGLGADVVPVLDAMVLRHAVPLAGEMDGRAVALVHHLAALSTPEERQSVRDAERGLLPSLRRVVATSEVTASRLRDEYGVSGEQLRVVVPGVAELPRSTGSGGPGCAVLAVGRLAARKGHDVLLQALARLADLPWHLDVVGDGFAEAGHVEMLADLAQELGVAERLRVHPLPDAAMRERLWTGADVFALASRRETTGAVIAEAMRRGLPVAAMAGGGMVPSAAGCVCAPDDEVTLSRSLRRMIFDTVLRAEMADASWKAGQALADWNAQARLFLAAIG